MKPVVRTSFVGTRPPVVPPRAVRFSAETTENRNKNWDCPTGSPVIATIAYSVPGSDLNFPKVCSKKLVYSIASAVHVSHMQLYVSYFKLCLRRKENANYTLCLKSDIKSINLRITKRL